MFSMSEIYNSNNDLADVIARENFRRNMESGMPGNGDKVKGLFFTILAVAFFFGGTTLKTPYNAILYAVAGILFAVGLIFEISGMVKNNKENKKIRELSNSYISSQTKYFDNLNKLTEAQIRAQNAINNAQLNNVKTKNENNSNIKNNNNNLITSNNNDKSHSK